MPAKGRRRIFLISALRTRLSKYSKLAELIFFPSFCELCSSLLEFPGEKVVCHACLESIKAPRSSYCIICGRFFEYWGEPHICAECKKNPPPFSFHRSCGKYQEKLKDIILLYKYRMFQVLSKDLALLFGRILGKDSELWREVEAVVAVPLHPKKLRKRGFNQAKSVAKILAEHEGLEFIEEGLVKTKNIPPQTSLMAGERKRNVIGTFGIKKADRISGKTVLLIDDVYTTGSTLRECSAVLKKAGAKEVKALTLAQA